MASKSRNLFVSAMASELAQNVADGGNLKPPGSLVITELEGDLFECSREYSLAHCISADVVMGKGIARTFVEVYGRKSEIARQGKGKGEVAVLDITREGEPARFVYNLVTKVKCDNKPTHDDLRRSLEAMRSHCSSNNIVKLAMPRIGCGLDQLEWAKVRKTLELVFDSPDSGVKHIQVYTLPKRNHFKGPRKGYSERKKRFYHPAPARPSWFELELGSDCVLAPKSHGRHNLFFLYLFA